MLPAARLALLALLALSPRSALGAWPPDPGVGALAVCVAAGSQGDVASLADGAGGVFVVWADARSGNNDLYAQRISAAGVPLWAADGVPVCTAAGNQFSPKLAPDGAGGLFVAWCDVRGADNDIYAQRVNGSGAPQWAANGVAVAAVAGQQDQPDLAADGAGGALVAWNDTRNGTYDIYAHRLGATGTALWLANGVAVCTATSDQRYPEVVSDGAGGAIFAWSDLRAANYDVYAQRANSSGLAQWAANGVAVCALTGHQQFPQIVADGAGGVVLAWQDLRSGADLDIYAQRLSASGAARWTTNGVAACATTGTQLSPSVTLDGSGGAIVAWYDQRGADYDIYAQRFAPSGAVQWTANGVAVCSATRDQVVPLVVSDGAGGAIVAWYDGRNSTVLDHDVYAQRLSPSGAAFWNANGAAVSTAVGALDWLTLAPDGAGGALLAWQDNRGTNADVYAQRIEAYGNLGSPEPGITGVKDVRNDQGGSVKVSWDASYLDAAPFYSVTDYRLWRSVPAASLTADAMLARGFSADPDEAAASGRWLALPAAAGGYAWELAGTMDAGLLDGYSLVAATTSDSLAGSNPRTAFMVEARAGSSMISDRWFSAPDSGYSVDNLAPAAPAPFTGTYSAGASVLHWNPNTEADLAGYRLYRGSSAGFVPAPANLVTTQPDTGYVDAAGALYWYKLAALDAHGNESPVATLLPAGTTAVEAGASARAFLALGSANPVRAGGTTTLRFGMAAAGRASLALYDATGRRVRELAAGTLEAGEHAIAWDGRDEAGHAAAPGLYFARFETPGFTATRKLVVQD